MTVASDKRDIRFILGKEKLVPQPEITILGLELHVAALAVEIADTILEQMDTKFDTVTFHSDSKAVLVYIYNESRQIYVYMSNRVQYIRRSTNPEQWKYVSSNENSAAHASHSFPAGSLTHIT